MESVQKELVLALLESLLSRGLLSKNAWEKAVNLVHSDMDIPPLLEYSVSSTGEEREKGDD